MGETVPGAGEGTGPGKWEVGFTGLCKEGKACLSPLLPSKAFSTWGWFAVVEMKLGSLGILGRHATTWLHPQP